MCVAPRRRTASVSGNNSVVECDLAKVEVAGSNPVSRSNSEAGFREGRRGRLHGSASPPSGERPSAVLVRSGHDRRSPVKMSSPDRVHRSRSAPSPSGKAEVCKTSIPGSNPGGASNPKLSSHYHLRSVRLPAPPPFVVQCGPERRTIHARPPRWLAGAMHQRRACRC